MPGVERQSANQRKHRIQECSRRHQSMGWLGVTAAGHRRYRQFDIAGRLDPKSRLAHHDVHISRIGNDLAGDPGQIESWRNRHPQVGDERRDQLFGERRMGRIDAQQRFTSRNCGSGRQLRIRVLLPKSGQFVERRTARCRRQLRGGMYFFAIARKAKAKGASCSGHNHVTARIVPS